MLCLWTRYDILCVPRWWYRWRGKGTKVNILLSSVSRITPLHIYHTLPLHLVSLDRNFQIWWTCTDGMAGGDHVTDASAGYQWWVAGAYKTTSVSGVWLRQTKHTLLVSRPFHSCCWPPYVSLCNGTITLSKAQLCYRLTVIPLNPTWLQHTKFELPRWGLFPSNYPWLQMSLATRCGNTVSKTVARRRLYLTEECGPLKVESPKWLSCTRNGACVCCEEENRKKWGEKGSRA